MVLLGNYEKQMPSRCSGATILTTLEQEIMTIDCMNNEIKLPFVHLPNKM